MAAKPAEPEHPGAAPGGHGQPAPRSETEGQRWSEPEPIREHEPTGAHTGPVAIARHRKRDGRALILYSRDTPT
jgi:hypothetical protein